MVVVWVVVALPNDNLYINLLTAGNLCVYALNLPNVYVC
jgi:hypothetical protein